MKTKTFLAAALLAGLAFTTRAGDVTLRKRVLSARKLTSMASQSWKQSEVNRNDVQNTLKLCN
jgi:hypothetical protein